MIFSTKLNKLVTNFQLPGSQIITKNTNKITDTNFPTYNNLQFSMIGRIQNITNCSSCDK